MKKQVSEKFGFDLHQGTLNLKVKRKTDASTLKTIRKLDGIRLTPTNPTFCEARCFRSRIKQIESAIVIPQVPDYPNNIMELIAPVHLRKTLNLAEDDEVEVLVFV